ncbi:hypothetical protein CMV_000221 [Castanea mollissima]|uniref:Uncharacterized protein n=1 Tax=Castanea mollissima TaxID=60419 RepID=A0A8J4S1R2_9ROSI|nr:hypothetical protein CMV_000221 [Castanea mollissima]
MLSCSIWHQNHEKKTDTNALSNKKKKKVAKILHGSTSSNKSGRSSSLQGIQISSEEYRQREKEEICEPKAGLSNIMEQMASFIQGMQHQSRTGFQGIDVGSGAQDKQYPHTQGSSVASHENEQQGNKTI